MYAATQNTPSLSLFKNHPRLPINGVGRLPVGMTINSIEVAPDFVYCAGAGLVDVNDWRPYLYGENLDRVVVATAPTVNAGSPYLGSLDDSVKFNASDYYQAGNNTFADITTEDFVIEAVIKADVDGTTNRIMAKWGGAAQGWVFQIHNSNTFRLFIGSGTGTNVISETPVNGAWYHVIFFMDRSGSGQCYVDGVASGAAVSLASDTGSLTIAAPLSVGGVAAGSPYGSNIAWLATWKRAAWLDTHLQATVARSRANLLQGVTPFMARGTAAPTVQTRASTAHLDKIESDGTRRIYLMGSGALRLCERIDSNGKKLKGYLPEVQITNLCLRSGEIDVDGAGAPWTHTNCSVTNTSTTTLPNGDTSVNDVIHEDGTAGVAHRVVQTVSVTAVTNVISCYAKAINRSWFYLQLYNGRVFFDLTNGVTGATTGTVDYGMDPCGNGWYRCWLSHVPAAGPRPVYLAASDADGNTTHNGLNQDSLYCWGVQIEAGVDYPTSYMPTGATEEIREEDVLYYKGDDGNIGGVGSNLAGDMFCRFLVPNYNNTVILRLLATNDGGASTARMGLIVDTPDGIAGFGVSGGATQWSISSGTQESDNIITSARMLWETDNAEAFVDGVSIGTNTSGTPPSAQDRLMIGANVALVGQPNCIVADIEFFERVQRKVG